MQLKRKYSCDSVPADVIGCFAAVTGAVAYGVSIGSWQSKSSSGFSSSSLSLAEAGGVAAEQAVNKLCIAVHGHHAFAVNCN